MENVIHSSSYIVYERINQLNHFLIYIQAGTHRIKSLGVIYSILFTVYFVQLPSWHNYLTSSISDDEQVIVVSLLVCESIAVKDAH